MPVDTPVVVGESTMVDCVTTGDPKPDTVWKKNIGQLIISSSYVTGTVYCRSGNFRVFTFSQISDFGTFHEV